MNLLLSPRRLIFLLSCSLAVFLLTTPLPALRADTPTKIALGSDSRATRVKMPYQWYAHTEWATESWSGNDKPYQIIRAQLDAALDASPKLGSGLLAKYAAAAKTNPSSPTALFRWAFASLKLAPQPLFVGKDSLDGVRNAFGHTPSPHTYNYSRLRFLLYQHASPGSDLIQLGERLLKHQPNDFSVQYYYIASLKFGPTLADNQKASVEVDRLIRQEPNAISLYALKGSIYSLRWAGDQTAHVPKKADGDLSIAAYQEYLKRAPANDPLRKNIQDVIHIIQTR